MKLNQTRREILATLAAVTLLSARPGIAAEQVIELTWDDLVPTTGETLMETAREFGVIEHDQISTMTGQPLYAPTTNAYNGKLVRIPGFVVPLDYGAEGVTTFILVPYVGACIHVPPPPANQLVLVTTETPQTFSGLFEPVWVTGMFGSAANSTELADIGYALSAEKIEPYEG